MKKLITVILLVAVCAACLNEFGVFTWRDGCHRDTLRVTVYDTIPYIKPTPTDSTLLGYVTEKLPVSVPKLQKNALKFPKSREKLQDSVVNFSNNVPNFNFGEEVNFPINTDDFPDSINVKIPITQKVYEDSMYKAYISGYMVSLDSFYIYPRREVITIREKPRRWHIGISAGYGITPKGFQPYIGVGMTYRLISF